MEIDMTREEAIKELRGFIGQLTEGCQEAIKVLIPELAESEDETIRKVLVNIVKSACSEYGVKYRGDKITEGMLLAYLEKQKEQKSVHTAKEMWKEMRFEVYAQASGNRHEPNYSDDSTKMFSLCDIDEIFEKIGNSTIGSQSAEWSEEDEKMVETICKEGDLKPSEQRWLNSLKNRGNFPSWKPSEEELEALNYAIAEWDGGKRLEGLYALRNDLKKLI